MANRFKIYCVYLLSFLNGKFYVGLTQNFQERITNHYNKFSCDFNFQILHNSLTIIQAGIWERIETANYNSYFYAKDSKGYNKTLGGDCMEDAYKINVKKSLMKRIENNERRFRAIILKAKINIRRIIKRKIEIIEKEIEIVENKIKEIEKEVKKKKVKTCKISFSKLFESRIMKYMVDRGLK